MLFSSILPLLALSLSSCVLADAKAENFTPVMKATAIAVRDRLSTIGASIPCSTVSGLASPQPEGSICDLVAEPDDSRYLISYTSETYVESLAACGEICLETSGCTNLYFAEGQYCNLHYGPADVLATSTAAFRFYDAICFSCSALTTSSSSTISTTSSTLSSKIYSSSTGVSSTAVTTAVTSTQTFSSTSTQSLWTSIQTDPALYNMAITTTYTQSAQCTGGAITQMAFHGTNLWENDIYPLATSTVTTCYPSQFYSSVMAAVSSIALPAFSALVCPYNWETINYNETYIVCCPKFFNAHAPYYYSNPDRPFSGAVCTSVMGPDVLMDITSYDSTAYWTVVPTSAGDDGTIIRANAFDGIIATANAAAKTSPFAVPTTATSRTSISTSYTPAATVSISGSSGARNLYNFELWPQFCIVLLHLLVSVVFA